MFFERVLKFVEAKVQSAVSRVSGAAMALAPLVVAIGFGTAAADSCLKDAYGERVAYLGSAQNLPKIVLQGDWQAENKQLIRI
jgi:hypothetical protein